MHVCIQLQLEQDLFSLCKISQIEKHLKATIPLFFLKEKDLNATQVCYWKPQLCSIAGKCKSLVATNFLIRHIKWISKYYNCRVHRIHILQTLYFIFNCRVSCPFAVGISQIKFLLKLQRLLNSSQKKCLFLIKLEFLSN